ncbi:dihydrolipoamide acetyltransferase [Tieghemostelium lacteum]|uniref:Acetyltransferase component of pyruvate dehydrogenase complex n=1 Tax=Tieghemostelium lacteum TaxID=361077 RepID=A0A152A4Y6_TIELA|nr:dihydrolipoamide acetyltransferase [Tieghemostelium lacteum]|eukprot:KYR01298.1 dihydrolipoamide acetyltransferase [Tieghemostelium lacteum]
MLKSNSLRVIKQITSLESKNVTPLINSVRSFSTISKQTIKNSNVSSKLNNTTMTIKSSNNINQISFTNNSVLLRFYSTKSKAKEITMPALSPTMESGNIAKWKKKEGDKIEVGQAIAEIETDKATMDFEYEEQSGYLAKILVPEGSKNITVNTPIALIVSKKEDIESAKDYKGASSTTTQETPKVQTATKEAPKKAAASTKSWPKHTVVGLPALSPTMESGGLSKWVKKVGDKISAGEVIAQVETDKATIDFEYQESGFLAKILVSEGTSGVSVDQPVCIVVPKKEDVDKFADFTIEDGIQEEPAQERPVESTSTSTSTSSSSSSQHVERSSGDRIFISPAAKFTAKEKDIDYSNIAGTGPNNRIIKADVLNYTPQPKQQQQVQTQQVARESPKQQQQVSTSQNYIDVPHSNIRRVTAKRLTESKQTIPHYYLTMECRVDKLLKMRTELNSKSENKFKLSINDFIIKAASAALKDVPTVNSTWMADAVRKYHNIDINVAVNTEWGLFTPIVRDVDKRGLASISNSVKQLAEKANANKLTPQEFETGTFTISNLGMFGIKSFSAVINPPQAAILAVGTTETRYVPGTAITADGQPNFEQATILNVTLSCDHRVIDGAIGAEWLQKFKDYMENPLKLLL